MASIAMRIAARRATRVFAQNRRAFAEAAPAVAQAENMVFTFASPVEAFYDQSTDIKQVDVPTGAGVIGILAKHVPIFGVLKPGVMTVYGNDGKNEKYFVSSGSFAVNEDSTVQIMAEEAVPVDQLDKDAARANLTKAQAALSSAASELEKAEAQVEVECYIKGKNDIVYTGSIQRHTQCEIIIPGNMPHQALSETGGRPEDIGILAIEIYFPACYVDQAKLEEYDGVSAGKYTKGLGQSQMGFCSDNEDINSLCLTALANLMEKHQISYSDIGRLEVGTETIIDKSKSVKSVLMQLFKESGNFDVEGVDTTNACYGGTSALFNAVAWLESSAWDGRYAAVVCGDIAVYSEGNARCTGGAGAVAMLIGPNAPLVIDPGLRGTYMRHAYDFYKPDLTSEYPVVDGKLSVQSYITALDNCYQTYCRKAASKLKSGTPFCLKDLDYMVFHSPYCKLVKKSLARLTVNDFLHDRTKFYSESDQKEFVSCENFRSIKLEESVFNRDLETAFMKASSNLFQSKTEQSLMIANRVGNMYTPSLYSCLVSVLISSSLEDLAGKRIGLFSYGSGLAASFFSIHVCNVDSDEKKRSLSRIVGGLSHVCSRLDARTPIEPEHFTKTLRLRQGTHLKSDYSPSPPTNLFPGTFYLTHVDDKFRRTYARTPTRHPVGNGTSSHMNGF